MSIAKDPPKKNKKYLIEIMIIGALILGAALIFALRYLPVFQMPNFYGEDGNIYVNNILHKNLIASALSGFNGYLIVGEYIITDFAVAAYKLLGLHFYQLPQVMAAASCLFLGLTVTLPYILFRKELGRSVAVTTVVLGAFVAMPTYDYAIIGTIGNLKFVFMYWAVLLIIYRNIHHKIVGKTVVVDLLLFLCVLTNASVFIILPLTLLPYRQQLLKGLKTRNHKLFLSPGTISALALLLLSSIYIIVIYIKGIPKLPTYLDTPYNWHATIKIIFRTTLYSWLYPISNTMRDLLSVSLLAIISIYGLMRRESRVVMATGLLGIGAATISFTVNRPGISNYFLTYGPNPDQFFYAQNLIFIFICMWLLKTMVDFSNRKNILILFVSLTLFLWWSVPYGSSFGRNKVIYQNLGTAEYNLGKACRQPARDIVFQVYPAAPWNWTISKDIACK